MRTSRAVVGWTVFLSALSAGTAASAPIRGWQQSGPSYQVHGIAPARDGSETVYAVATDSITGRSGAFRSMDDGETWELLAESLPGDTASAIAVDPHDSSRLLAATVRDTGGGNSSTRLYVSTDGGTSWRLGGDFASACGGEFAFADTDIVYVALRCSGQLLASRDAGESWQGRETRLGLLRSGPFGELYGLEYGDFGLIRSVDGGFRWTHEASPPCASWPPTIYGMTVDSLGRLFVSTAHVRMIFNDCPGVFRSDDGGRSWMQISDFGGVLTDIVIDGSEPSRIYASAAIGWALEARGVVFASEDGGHSWNSLGAPVPMGPLALSSSGRLLYAASDQGLYRLPIFKPRKPRVVAPR